VKIAEVTEVSFGKHSGWVDNIYTHDRIKSQYIYLNQYLLLLKEVKPSLIAVSNEQPEEFIGQSYKSPAVKKQKEC
jgi:hypothetical protein